MKGFHVARRRLGAAALILASCLCGTGTAKAQIGSDRYAAIVQEAETGRTLIAASPDEQRHPASLTKMMTIYMLFEALRERRIALRTPIRISEEAASRPPSKLGLPPGSTITAEQAVLALVTKSANDVAAAVGEHLGGSEDHFAQMMTLRARALGMRNTRFRNASGLPDVEQVTTARDMALLGRRLIQDFPEHYHYFGTVRTQVRNIRLRSHNRMLESYDGADGIKTGYIRDSGFNIVTSAERGGVRLIGVVFGGSSWTERDQHMAALLDQGFARSGVTPRETEVASRRGPTLVSTAAAASTARVRPATTARPRGATATRQAARVTRRPRAQTTTATRRAAAVRQARPSIEQGDRSPGRASRQTVRRTTAARSPSAQTRRAARTPARRTTSRVETSLGRQTPVLPPPQPRTAAARSSGAGG